MDSQHHGNIPVLDAVDDYLDILGSIAARHAGRHAGSAAAAEATALFESGISALLDSTPARRTAAPSELATAIAVFRLATVPLLARKAFSRTGNNVSFSGASGPRGRISYAAFVNLLSGGSWDHRVASRVTAAVRGKPGLLELSGSAAEGSMAPDSLISLTDTGCRELSVLPGLEWVESADRAAVDPKCSNPGLKARDAEIGLSDLVLEPDLERKLRFICSAVSCRKTVFDRWGYSRLVPWGRSVTCLFFGPPGTGKTVAAAAVAGESGLPLLRIDLSGLFSKWVGETEKNLAKVFDAASASGAVLLFDEADAVFSKRGEQDSASDKYANLQSGYLLQRLESFDGTAILTTNLPENIDPAFRRRIRFKVEFPYPGREARRRMWERMLPAGLPQAPGIDMCLKRLSVEWEFPPALISSACLRAAFEAAGTGNVVTSEMLVAAAAAEGAEGGLLVKKSGVSNGVMSTFGNAERFAEDSQPFFSDSSRSLRA